MIGDNTPCKGGRVKFDGKDYEITYASQGMVRLRGTFGSVQKSLCLAEYLQLRSEDRIVPQALIPGASIEAIPVKPATELQLIKFNRMMRYVTAAFYELSPRCPTNETTALIERVAEEIADPFPPKYSTLKQWLADYLKSDADPLCFHPSKKKRKKREKKLSQHELALLDLSEAMLRTSIYDEYLTPAKATATACYRSYKGAVAIANRSRPEYDQLPILSHSTFSRRIDEVDAMHAATAIHGRAIAKKMLRSSAAIRKALFACSIVEVDSNVMDVLAVDDDGNILGRPTLITIICTSTGVLVGYDISLSPPCADTVKRAIRHAVSDASGRKFSGKFHTIRMDRGTEYNNGNIHSFLNNLGIRVVVTAPRQPNQKPFVESFYDAMNTDFMHRLRGTTRSNPKALGDEKPAEKACWRIEELRQAFIEWEENIFHHLGGIGSSDLTPTQRWNHLVHKLPPSKIHDVELEILSRSATESAISGGRVRFLGLSYFAPSLADMTWHRNKIRRKNVKVYYDESNLSHVYIQDPDDPSTEYRADATNPSYQHGLTMHEHKIIRARMSKERKSSELDFCIAYRQYLLDLYARNEAFSARQRTLIEEKRNGRQHRQPMTLPRPHYPIPELVKATPPEALSAMASTIPSVASANERQRPSFSTDKWSK